ncbi:carbohydrate-binding protein [Micromonospora sp. H33]|uniref:carbohydrate-binding protein n=1 Tax=Micromonospora sp. H33 TaxID=3452215 RepID=UPI003F8A4381
MRRRTLIAAAGVAAAAPVIASQGAQADVSALGTWQLRWAPEASQHGLGAFEGVEDDRADSHPAGQPHIFVEGNNYRFNMHMIDRDSMTDRQRQEVKGMRWNGGYLNLLRGERWRLTHEMYIPTSLKATTTFTHIMQTKAPGTGTSPMLVMSLRRHGSVPRIEFKATSGDVLVGAVDLSPLHNRWIDVEVEMLIGDAGQVRWVLRDGTTTLIDVTRNVDTWLEDRVRPKWGIYRSLGDTSGSLQDCYLLIRNMRAYRWDASAPAPRVYQAEDALISQGVVESNHEGYTGTGFVNTDNVAGCYVEFTVTGPATSCAIRYANGSTTNRPMTMSTSGASVNFPPTGAWSTWSTVTVPVSLGSGTHKIRLTASTSNGGPNLDKITLSG